MPPIQVMKRDIEMTIEFYRRFISMDEARRELMRGGAYLGDKKLAFERSWDHLVELEPEMKRITTAYKEATNA